MIKRIAFFLTLCFCVAVFMGTNVSAVCKTYSPPGVTRCFHDLCFTFYYKAMKPDSSAACLSVYFDTVQGGWCMNPATKVPVEHPGQGTAFWNPNYGITISSLVKAVYDGGKWIFGEDESGDLNLCFNVCDELTNAPINFCNNNWEFVCTDDDVNAYVVYTWNAGYQEIGNSDGLVFQTGLCIRHTAVPCIQDDPDCGSCGLKYTREVLDDPGECISRGLYEACEQEIDKQFP